MAKVYQSATDLIGNTPLLEVTKLEKSKGLEAKVLIKLEYFNTSGSVKDRAAYYMVKDAEEKGLLKEGSVIIEPTSGNTGIGLASIAAAKGYRIILTMPETMSVERRNILKAYVNFYARMQGAIDNLQMRGKLDVLGSTDMTYVLKDSPITTDNQLEDLVKFTNFADSTTMDIERPPLNGFSMDMNISINESAHILCALNANKSNYVDLIGGGDLRMKYNTIDELSLRGRYTLNNGSI